MRTPLKKQKTLGDHVGERVDEIAIQAEVLRQQIAERAPGVRDQLIEQLPDLDDLRERLPEWREEMATRLPESVSDRLPESVRPKKKSKLKKVALIGLVLAAGGAAFAAARQSLSADGARSAGQPYPAPPTPPAGDHVAPMAPPAPDPASESEFKVDRDR